MEILSLVYGCHLTNANYFKFNLKLSFMLWQFPFSGIFLFSLLEQHVVGMFKIILASILGLLLYCKGK